MLELLARQPPCFSSMPMLGIAMELDSRCGDSSVLKQDPKLRDKMNELPKALEAAHHHDCLAALIVLELESISSAIAEGSQRAAAHLKQVQQLSQALQKVNELPPKVLQSLALYRRTAKNTTDVFNTNLGSGSPCSINFRNTFNNINKSCLQRGCDEIMAHPEVRGALVDGVVEGVLSEVDRKFLSRGEGHLQQLLLVLQPIYNWRHEKFSLKRFLTKLVAAALPVEQVVQLLLQEVRPQVLEGCRDVMSSLLVSYMTGVIEEDGWKEEVEWLVDYALFQKMDFDHNVGEAFRKAFFPRATKPAAYQKCYER